jgi:predicted transcriptional regulator
MNLVQKFYMRSRNLHRKIANVDQNTGEVLEGVIVYCGVKCNPYGKGWVMNSQEALEMLASDKELTGETLRVLLFLLSRLDFENWIQIAQIEIAEKLDIRKSQISRSIKLLTNKGILLEGPKAGRSFAYRLNPDYGWKGKVKNLNEYRQEQENQANREFKNRHLKVVNNPIKSDESE